MSDRTCIIDGCSKPHMARGWCNAHYKRWKTHGDPTAPRLRAPSRDRDVERFWSYVVKGAEEADCWEWSSEINYLGYSRIYAARRKQYAHRFAYELLVGPIPEGLKLDHLCRNRGCVNPAHLEPVTQRENIRRGVGPTALNAAKTECVNGHPFDEVNTYITTRGNRACKACVRAAGRRRDERNRKKRAA